MPEKAQKEADRDANIGVSSTFARKLKERNVIPE